MHRAVHGGGVDKPGFTEARRPPVDQTGDAIAGDGLDLVGLDTDQQVAGGRHDGGGKRVVAVAFQGRRDRNQVALGGSGGRNRRNDRRRVASERAGLVQRHDADPGERLDSGAALDQHAHAGSGAHRRDDGDRDGDGEGAGSGCDQHDQGPPDPDAGIAERRPDQCDTGRHDENRRDEGTRNALGQPLGMSLALLCLLDQVHDPGEGAVLGGDRRLDSQKSATVDRTGKDRVVRPDIDGDRLAGNGRQVDHRRARTHGAVGRQSLPRSQHDDIARDQLRRADDGGGVVALDRDAFGDEFQQRPQTTAGASQRPALQCLGDREQKRKRRGFTELAEHHRADCGNRHEGRDAKLASTQRPNRVGDEGGATDDQPGQEQNRRRGRRVEPTSDQPCSEEASGCGGDSSIAHLPQRRRPAPVFRRVGGCVVGATGVSHVAAPAVLAGGRAPASAEWQAPQPAPYCPPGSDR